MTELNVALPDDLQRYVDARVAQEGFADPADFLRDLVRRDQDGYEADVRRVRALIQEGIDSGVVDAEPEDVLDEIIAGIHQRHG
jgi:antitoxin ParD1/3/4